MGSFERDPIGQFVRSISHALDLFAEDITKRVAETGAFTHGSCHLEDPTTWVQIPKEEVEEWFNDPEPNPDRDWAVWVVRMLLERELFPWEVSDE